MIRKTTQQIKVLDFDIENRPLSYWFGDVTTSEITAIAASWIGSGHVYCWILGEVDAVEMLDGFGELYDQADMVTGHFIRRHDLPIINGAMMENDLLPLSPKMTQDTKLDLKSRRGIPASQESLGAMFDLPAPKIGMTQSDWREANRLTEEGFEKTRMRVVGDVVQHKQLREELLRRQLLKPPKVWKP